MREGIHPKYNEVKVTCTCGNEFVTRSTKEGLRLELCNKCHPFFTGKQRFIDSAGRVERFKRKYGKGTAEKPEEKKTDAKAKKATPKPAPKKKAVKKKEVAAAPEEAENKEN